MTYLRSTYRNKFVSCDKIVMFDVDIVGVAYEVVEWR